MFPIIRIAVLAAALSDPSPSAPPPQTAAARPEEPAILDVVDRFMQAISTNDAAAMTALRIEGGIITVERPAASGGTQVTRRVFQPSPGRPGESRERYWDPIVHVRGSLAVVWTPYEFWSGGKSSHCGIDVFELVKEQGAWRIGNVMWTVEPDACPALRPSDPARIRPKG